MIDSLQGLTFDDILLKPQRGVLEHREDADISVPELGLKIPLIAAPMPSLSSYDLMSEIRRLGGTAVINRMKRPLSLRVIEYFANPDLGVAVGLDLDEFESLYDTGARVFWMDIAHGHSDRGIAFVKWVKKFPGAYLIAGSVATAEGAYELAQAGADGLRVGIGPGSVCTTRQVTGFGVPQLQAIEECKIGSELPVIADGGIRNSGDIVKALAAGADAVMIGGLFARAKESATNGWQHYGNASSMVNGHRAPEGISINYTETPEPLEDIVKRLCWGIRSGISYAGATNIRELQEMAQWIKLTDAGRTESKL